MNRASKYTLLSLLFAAVFVFGSMGDGSHPADVGETAVRGERHRDDGVPCAGMAVGRDRGGV